MLLLLSTICLVISLIVRTTSLFLLPIIGFPLLYYFFNAIKNKDMKNILKWGIIGAGILGSALAMFGYIMMWQYWSMCHSARGNHELCGGQFANVYSYVQAKYWDVGLLTYYKLSNLLFIVLGLPAVVLSLIFFPFTRIITHLFQSKAIPLGLRYCTLGLQISLLSYLLVTVLLTNIQSSTRFLCTHSAFYINCVDFLCMEHPSTQDS